MRERRAKKCADAKEDWGKTQHMGCTSSIASTEEKNVQDWVRNNLT